MRATVSSGFVNGDLALSQHGEVMRGPGCGWFEAVSEIGILYVHLPGCNSIFEDEATYTFRMSGKYMPLACGRGGDECARCGAWIGR